MNLIRRIDVHRFRSIADENIDTSDITIFSGLNNSGKSNVLRALNLFFNEKTGFSQMFDFDIDYNKAFTGRVGGKREMSIKVHFKPVGNAALSKPFAIKRTFHLGQEGKTEYSSTDEEIQAKIDNNDGNVLRQFTTFINKIEYFYIPAVRDRVFTKQMFLHFEKLIEHSSSKDFESKLHDIAQILNDKSEEISKDFESFIHLPTRAILSSKATDLLGTVEINVETGIRVNRRKKIGPAFAQVNLFSSGDGILMSYLAYFLAHISRKITNKYFVWGFEEPENSLEYSKVQRMAEEFCSEFKNYAQIFITSHSPAFISKRDQEGVMLYRVYIEEGDSKQSSKIRTLTEISTRQQALFNSGEIESVEYVKLSKELNFVEFANEIEVAVKKVKIRESELIESINELENMKNLISRTRPLKIFICEDSDPKVLDLWKWLLNLFSVHGVTVISSEGSQTHNVEIFVKQQSKLDPNYKPKVFRQIDRDGLTNDQISKITDKLFAMHLRELDYKYVFLPVNEMENFAVISDENNFNDSFWQINKQKVTDAFECTAESVLKKHVKNFNSKMEAEGHELFESKNGGYTSIIHGMRDEAEKDWRRFFPGKEVCKRVPNYNAVQYVRSLNKDNLPILLSEYILEVVNFLNN